MAGTSAAAVRLVRASKPVGGVILMGMQFEARHGRAREIAQSARMQRNAQSGCLGGRTARQQPFGKGALVQRFSDQPGMACCKVVAADEQILSDADDGEQLDWSVLGELPRRRAAASSRRISATSNCCELIRLAMRSLCGALLT